MKREYINMLKRMNVMVLGLIGALCVCACNRVEDKQETLQTELPPHVFDRKEQPVYEEDACVEESEMQKIFAETCTEMYKKEANIYATHAGLECGIFAGKIEGLDAISIGPDAFDIHTVFERLSISSVNNFFDFLKEILVKLK